MDAQPTPYIVEVERWNGSVIITFDDGKSALYSASLLRAMIDEAQVLPNHRGTKLPGK
jgi:DUF971 family protein